MILELIDEAVRNGARQRKACALIGLNTRTVQRWRAGDALRPDGRTLRVFEPPHKLSVEERAQVLAICNSAEFGTLAPSQIVPRLADRGEYVASESTFYRILKAEDQLAHRRAEKPGKPRAKPQSHRAEAPNRLYSWDITYLPTPIRGQFYYLYLFLDLYSRKIVGWAIHEEENSQFAAELLGSICQTHAIPRDQLILHSDNGSPMKGATMFATFQRLGVIPSFSRPAVSNDNPYSEALFRTVKYCPYYPQQPFADLEAARAWMTSFVQWYNHQHRHSALRYVTPEQRHQGLDHAILAQRRAVYETTRARHPQRWSGEIRNWTPIDGVELNPSSPKTKVRQPRSGVCQGQALRPGAAHP
jgi:transposase InsO family protein